MKIIRKKYTDLEAESILNITRAAQDTNKKGFFHNSDVYFSLDNISKHLYDNGIVFFASENDHYIGTLSLCNEKYGKRIQNYLHKESQSGIKIRFVAVLPEWRGRGIAKQLVGEAIQYCEEQNFDCVVVNTAYDNKPAIHLYLNCGFKPVDVHFSQDHLVIDMVHGRHQPNKVIYYKSLLKAIINKRKAGY